MFLVFVSLAWNCFHENVAQVSECGDSSPIPRSQQSLLDHTAKKSDTYEECYHSKKDVLGPPQNLSQWTELCMVLVFFSTLDSCDQFVMTSSLSLLAPVQKHRAPTPRKWHWLNRSPDFQTGPLIFSQLAKWRYQTSDASETLQEMIIETQCITWSECEPHG